MIRPVYEPELVDAEWLTGVLQEAGLLDPRSRVDAFEAKPIGTGQVGSNVRYRLSYEAEELGPESVVLKFASADESSRATGIQTLTYESEVAFYNELADTVEVSRPACYYASIEPGTADVVLVLEDMVGASAGDQLAGCSPDQALLAMEQAARLHGPRWGDAALRQVGILAARRESASEPGPILAMLWPTFVELHSGRLTHEAMEVGARLAACRTWTEADPPGATICHRDYRLDNMLFGHGTERPLTVVDWQTVSLRIGTSDVAYFLGAAMPPAERRRHEQHLVAEYHRWLSEYDIGDYGPDQCWADYRRYSFDGFFMAVFAGVLVQRTERGDSMFVTMANGAAAHAVDLDAFDFLT